MIGLLPAPGTPFPMTLQTTASERIRQRPAVHWMPRQHGAWAMLGVPLVLGVLASRPDPWQLALAGAAVSAYIASSNLLEWTRARRPAYLRPAAAFGAVLVVSGLALIARFPPLVWFAAGMACAGLLALAIAAAGHPRSIGASLTQSAQAVLLAPAAAVVAGIAPGAPSVLHATLVAGLYLLSSVLVVRSMIRERGSRSFLAASVAYHAAAVFVEAAVLPWAYAAIGVLFEFRAVALPLLQQRLADTPRRLRPVHVGLVELCAAAALVLVAAIVRF